MLRLLTVAFVLLCAAPASAADVTATTTTEIQDDGRGGRQEIAVATVSVTAAPGASDDLTVDRAGRDVRVVDQAGASAGAGCRQVSSVEVLCDAQDRAQVTVALGDGDDRARVVNVIAEVDGGEGDDVLESDNVKLKGGPGADTLVSGASMDGGAGPDVMRGGGHAVYADRTAPVTVTAGGGADDGEAGEGDDVSEVAGVTGGSGDDHLTASGTVYGGGGDDTLAGGAGQDFLHGEEGDDAITAGGGDDSVEGGSGADRIDAGAGADDLRAGQGVLRDHAPNALAGGAGDDRIIGDAGPDTIDGGPGRDEVAGQAGGDTIRARDGELDVLACGARAVRASGNAELDVRDVVRSCRRIDRSGVPRARVVFTGRLDGSPEAGAIVGCPQDARGGCRVRATIGARGRTLGRLARTIRAGRMSTFSVRLDPRALRRLPREPAPAGTPSYCHVRRLTLIVSTRTTAGKVVLERHRLRYASTSGACGSEVLLPSLAAWD